MFFSSFVLEQGHHPWRDDGPPAAVEPVASRIKIATAIPLLDRLRLRPACRAFQSAVDDSLEEISELFWEDIAGVAMTAGGLDLLVRKCPNLRTLSLWPRSDQGTMFECRTPIPGWMGGRPARPEIASPSLLGIAHCTRLRSLNLAGCADMDDALLAALAASCRELDSVDVSYCRVTDAGITELAQLCPGLKELSAGGMRRVTDASIEQVAANCQGLRRLDVGGTCVTDASVSAIARHCADLRHLGLGGAKKVTDDSIRAVAERCPSLQYLGVSGGLGVVSDASIIEIARRCRSLTGLDVHDCDNGPGGVRDLGLRAVAQHCPDLQYLSVGGLRHVRRETMIQLAARCPKLRHLDAGGGPEMDDEVIDALTSGCPGLRHLAVAYLSDVTDASVIMLADRCHELEHLSVLACPRVTDVGISAVARRCLRLRHLDVRACIGVTAASLILAGELCERLEELRVNMVMDESMNKAEAAAVARSCARLRSVEVGHMDKALLRAIVQKCVQLENLHVWNACFHVGWRAIGRKCARLRSLLVTNCETVSDKHVGSLLAGPLAGQLVHLDLSACHNITDESLVAVGRACVQLRTLKLSSAAVTDVGLRAIVRGCPRLTFLDIRGCDVTPDGLRMLNLDRCNVVHHLIWY
eukprot:jgi/Mesvir1/399/Mv11290-RA.1